jgi:endo-1,4-beta-xylanase
MYIFINTLLAVWGTATALATPIELQNDLEKRSEVVTTSTTGTYDGYYYSNYIESGSGATLTLGSGTYSLSWTTAAEDVVAGIGWSTGSARYAR